MIDDDEPTAIQLAATIPTYYEAAQASSCGAPVTLKRCWNQSSADAGGSCTSKRKVDFRYHVAAC